MSEAQLKTLQAELDLAQKTLDLIMAIDHVRDTVTEPVAMLTAIANLLTDHLQAELCLLFLIDRETGDIELKTTNHHDEKLKYKQYLINDKLAAQATHLDDITIWAGSDILPPHVLAFLPKTLQLAAVPIILADKKRLGTLLLTRSQPPFNPYDIQLLQTAEDQIDSAIMQGYVYYELQQHLKELEVIYHIDKIRDQQLPFDEMLDIVLQDVCQVIEAEMGFVMLYESSKHELEIRATTHPHLSQNTAYVDVINQFAHESLQQSQLVCHNGLGQSPQAIMCLPLILNDQIIGVLGVVNNQESQPFKSDERRLLAAIGTQMDTAIFESLEQRQLRQVLGRSVDPNILERLLASNDVDFLRGERAIITVLYADIRGSTSLAEQTDPELLVGFINHYLGQMTEIILEYGGTLDKFVGDEVMALFGAPFPRKDHALCAIQVGLAMQKAHQKVMDMWQDREVEAPPIGIGIATGELIVGEMGSPQRTQYTVIGRAANLGARICSSAQGGQVLISQATYDLVQDQVKAKPISGMEYKGVAGLITVYHVIGVLA